MKNCVPLIISSSSGIGKRAFSARLVKEYPQMFKITNNFKNQDS